MDLEVIEVGDSNCFVQQSNSVSGRATNPTTLIDNVPVFDLGPGVVPLVE